MYNKIFCYKIDMELKDFFHIRTLNDYSNHVYIYSYDDKKDIYISLKSARVDIDLTLNKNNLKLFLKY